MADAERLADFTISGDSYNWHADVVLCTLCVLSFICAFILTYTLYRIRHITRLQAQFMVDNAMDSLLNNSPDYALTEFVLLMAICDMTRSFVGAFQHMRSIFGLWNHCSFLTYSGVLCLAEEFTKWTCFSIDIICYGVICYCLFRYLRKRSIFTQHSITPRRIRFIIILTAFMCSAVQTLLLVLYEDHEFVREFVFTPSYVILFSTVIWILTVWCYIRCCHPFWILGKDTKSSYVFLMVFTIIFTIPLTLKV